MAQLLHIITVVLVIVAFFITAFIGARWARKKNNLLNAKGESSSEMAANNAILNGKSPYALEEFWAGNIAPWKALLGKILSVIIILVFSTFIGFAIFGLIEVI